MTLKKYPNKGTIDDTKNDVSNLIRLAFESRNGEKFIVLPSHQDLFLDEVGYSLPFQIVKDVRMNKHVSVTMKI